MGPVPSLQLPGCQQALREEEVSEQLALPSTLFLNLGEAESPCQLQGGRVTSSLGMDCGFGEAA